MSDKKMSAEEFFEQFNKEGKFNQAARQFFFKDIVIEFAKAYAEIEREKAFEAARELIPFTGPYWWSNYEDYKSKTPL
jgi:hypothetical protein